eukprot:GHVH01003284.1.p1 GENE.GHVH01003284.1~~GHVH01003284.1.p1  ORF type:complete len:304 (-),score=28.33 GHVH01003284.1:1812-2642(-)
MSISSSTATSPLKPQMNKVIDEMDRTVLNVMNEHSSCRAFAPLNVELSHLEEIITSAQRCSSSCFMQQTRIINITDKSTRDELYECSGKQPSVLSAPVFLMFVADMRTTSEFAAREQVSIHTGELGLTAIIDTAILAQNVMVAAESVGLKGCYIGGIRNELSRVQKLLCCVDSSAEPSSLTLPLFGMVLGYPKSCSEHAHPKPRIPLGCLLSENTLRPHDSDHSVLMEQYDSAVGEHYKSLPNRPEVTWSKYMSQTLPNQLRPWMESILTKFLFNK